MDKSKEKPPYFGPKGDALPDGRISGNAAHRNGEAIFKCIAAYVPAKGVALELASGTGQHIAELARRHKAVQWQPSDVTDQRMPSIKAWAKHVGADNLLAPIMLDAGGDWHEELPDDPALVFVANLFHVIPKQAALKVMLGVGRVLAGGGYFFIYGPFKVGGEFRSAGDAGFDASLKGKHMDVGLKDLEWMKSGLANAGLEFCNLHEMPANNLVIVVQKTDS
ncbi:DUF938 domain-containing protein [Profundibacter sp.]